MSATADPQSPSPWLYGPARDLFLGYGAAYLLSVPLFFWYFVAGGHSGVPRWFALLLSFGLITPHFGATILRAYERREDRRRYAIFTVWATLALALVFVGSLYSALVGSLVVTIYVSWGPWHFSGQNYGLGVMYLRRLGIPIEGPVKRAFYASFLLSAVLAFLSIHIRSSSLVYTRGASDPSGAFQLLQLGIPAVPGAALAGLVALGWIGCLVVVARHLLRSAAAGTLAPIVLLVSMQACWFALPGLAAATPLFDLPVELRYPFLAVWMSAAHSAQYLWVTSYYARRSHPGRGQLAYLGRAIVAGSAMLAPGLLFVPGLFGGSVPHGAGVPLLVLSMMNLHHFVLDGAIWKLRDGRVARVLLRSSATAEGPDAGVLRGLGTAAVGLVGGVFLLFQIYMLLLVAVVSRPEVELPVMEEAARQLVWLGKDSGKFWARFGSRLEGAGEPDRAIVAYGRSLEMQKPPDPRVADRVVRLILERHGDRPEMLRQADELARFVARSAGGTSPAGEELVAAVAAAQSDASGAVAAAERALAIARQSGSAADVSRIERDLETYRELARSVPAAEG